ncbi:MAG: TonB-dependent receptor [Elusimicrobia bacterium]|nr:TonB-dependent receptor [Elusimicrobiota bacterium]
MPRYRPVVAVVLAFSMSSAQAAPVLTVASESWRSPVMGANRLSDAPITQDRVPGAVTVIDRASIERSGARSLPELLGRIAGVNMFDANGNAFQPTLDMRGFNAQPVPATAVFVDGTRVNEPDFGQINWQLIPLTDVERVEVLPGPATLFGRGALSGVVSVTTRRAGRGESVAVETGAGYGAFQNRKGWASAQGTVRSFDWRFNVAEEKEEGWRQHSEGDVKTARVKAGWRPDAATDLAVSYERAADRMRMGGSITGPELAADPTQNVSKVETVSHLDMVVVEARRALPYDLSLSANANFRGRREDTPQNKGRTTLSKSLSNMNSRGVTVQLSRAGTALDRAYSLTAGAEGGRSAAASESFSAGFDSRSLVRDDSSAFFAQASVDLVPERLSATAGVRYDENRYDYEHVDSFTAIFKERTAYHRTSPKIGLNFNPDPRWTLYASYAEAFRAPTALELTPLGAGNGALLNPVQVKTYETGLRGKPVEEWTVAAAVFRGDAVDEIYYDQTVGAFGRNVNLPKTRRFGSEASVAWEGERWETKVGHAWTRAEFGSQITMFKASSPNQVVNKGDTLPMVPEHRGTLEVAFKPAPGWRLSSDAICVGSQIILGDEANNEDQLPGYCTANLGLMAERGAWLFGLRGTNITDARYQSRAILSSLSGRAQRFYVPAPGAGFNATVSWRWGTDGSKRTARRPRVDALELARAAVSR